LFYYSTGANETDHVYSFFLVSAFLLINYHWQYKANIYLSLLLGLVIGLISLIRVSETILVVFIFFWGVYNKETFKLQFSKLLNYKIHIAILIVCFTIVWLPQLLIWKNLTGNYFFRPGDNEQYFWLDPQIFNILFSFRKGWLLYSPLVILSFIGIFFMKGEVKKFRLVIIIVIITNIYILSCWWNWFYGGGFGGRVFIPSLAWLAIPIASLCTYLFQMQHTNKAYQFVLLVFFIIVFSGISLNLGQTYQYLKGYIHYDATSKESYKFMFGKYDLFGKEGDKYWTLLNYHDDAKLKSGEDRNK
jgi:hypothetical protein